MLGQQSTRKRRTIRMIFRKNLSMVLDFLYFLVTYDLMSASAPKNHRRPDPLSSGTFLVGAES